MILPILTLSFFLRKWGKGISSSSSSNPSISSLRGCAILIFGLNLWERERVFESLDVLNSNGKEIENWVLELIDFSDFQFVQLNLLKSDIFKDMKHYILKMLKINTNIIESHSRNYHTGSYLSQNFANKFLILIHN